MANGRDLSIKKVHRFSIGMPLLIHNSRFDPLYTGINILQELRLKPYISQGYLHLGELYIDSGQKAKALEKLRKAQKMFREMGMDYWLARTQKVLARL